MPSKRIVLGLHGEAVQENVKRVREARGLTFAALARALAAEGRPIPILGLRRVESGDRRLDIDDLVALGKVLGVSVEALATPGLKFSLVAKIYA